MTNAHEETDATVETLTVLCDLKGCGTPSVQHSTYDVKAVPDGGSTFRSKERCAEHRVLTLCKLILQETFVAEPETHTFTSWGVIEQHVLKRALAIPEGTTDEQKHTLTLVYCEGDTDELRVTFDYDLYPRSSPYFRTPETSIRRIVGIYLGRWKPADMPQERFDEVVRIARGSGPFAQDPAFLAACERVADSEGWLHSEDLAAPAQERDE